MYIVEFQAWHSPEPKWVQFMAYSREAMAMHVLALVAAHGHARVRLVTR